MRQLVALDLDGGPAFVEALVAVWDDGDVALPIDRALAAPARRALLVRARPHAIVSTPARREVLDAGAPVLASGDALAVATSGSTGDPHLLVHTHAGLAAHARAVHLRLDLDRNQDRWLACLPLNHLGGLGVVIRALLDDVALDVWARADVAALRGAPENLGTTLVSVVPTLADRIDLLAFRQVVVGGAADPTERPGNVVRTYGSTETGGGVVYDGVPLDDIEVRIGEQQVIGVRGATLARGRRATTGTVSPIADDDGWFTTGDLGGWDDDGRLLITGRADDLIVSGGENVWPQPVEAVLGQHPGVAEVVVIGRAHPTWGQEVTAVVVAADPANPPALEDLRARVRAGVSASAAPRALVVVDSIARTALGKPRRSAIARELTDRAPGA